MEITGKIIAVLEAKSGISNRTGNPWMSQEYVIETHEQYPRRCCFRIFGEDKIKNMNIQIGEELTVSFDIDAHQYQDRWFNEISCWKVDRVQPGAPAAAAPAAPVAPQSPIPAPATPAATEEDDLPF